MTEEQIQEIKLTLLGHFNLKVPESKIHNDVLDNYFRGLDAEIAYDTLLKIGNSNSNARSIADAKRLFAEFYRVEKDRKFVDTRKFTTEYKKSEVKYPDGRRHDEWHIFEVVVITEQMRKNPRELEKALQSYWILAQPLARAYTLFQDLLHYGHIFYNHEVYHNVNTMFEKTYKIPLLKFVGTNHSEYPSEVEFKELMEYLEKELIRI